jgi:hypothetical protein
LNPSYPLIASARPGNLMRWVGVAHSPRGQREGHLFEASTDVIQRGGSGIERLSLAYGLLACLAWGVLAPSSAMAACGSYVKPRKSAGSTELPMLVLAQTDVVLPPSAPLPRPGCHLCKGKPVTPPPLPAAVSVEQDESRAYLTTVDATPSLGGDWFKSGRDRFRPIHRTFLILHPPRTR